MTIRVLLADDHAMMRDGLKALLSTSFGMEVIAEVSNGRDAVARARELKPDVVVMDVAMPELNGIEAARLLREKVPASRIVMLSMHSSSEHVYRAFAAGATAYVLKESAGAELVAAVRSAHSGRRYLSPAIAELAPLMEAEGGHPSPLDSLSRRERQVLQLVVEGHSSATIAERVHLSPKTVETYRSRLMKKLRVGDVASLVKYAVQHGLTPSG
jgi:two-component system, NarL family, response regulator NreC